MIEAITQGLLNTLLIIAVLFFVFVAFIAWRIRAVLKDVFVAFVAVLKSLVQAFRKTIRDEYTYDEMIHNIGYFELRGNTKSADHWRRELARKFPEGK